MLTNDRAKVKSLVISPHRKWVDCFCRDWKGRFTVARSVTPISLCMKRSSQSLFSAAMARLISSISVNVTAGEKEDRMMITGLHTVADIYCVKCGSYLGWKYEVAYEENQKYKEGKSVLERFKVSVPEVMGYWAAREAQEARAGASDDEDDA
ncbi:PREDICTED: protein yippee-like At3g11230 isoform X1 [Tarenaya hassleriana]|uniref:protein yippee-like At3g11230 isoform X1 n=1 Tax=Tarenaya hassleriana TaxID=28532 RepID=UPI00053C940A|nr:PREDICTED: protein yippee-like At3g11230 isoform X1 [Tarenaya hassleriana]